MDKLEQIINGWDNIFHTMRRWYESIFEVGTEEEWQISLWCFWDDLRREDCRDIRQEKRFKE